MSPPVPILIGMQQKPPAVIGQAMPDPEPVVSGFFCPVRTNVWCKKWEPKTEGNG